MKRIVFVSRLDADCSLGAHLLCNIAARLREQFNDLSIIIVGGGTEYSKIQIKAEQINRKSNRRLIFLTGRVNDASKYFDKNTLFVGVSRAALEAMAYGLPIILLGNEGYLGLLNEDKLKTAELTNFTCRGAGHKEDIKSLQENLFKEICSFFELPEAERLHLGAFSYESVKKCYSAKKMAQNTESIYQKALIEYKKTLNSDPSKSPKIAVCGYYGHKNFGDEAILSVVSKKIYDRIPNARVCVMGSKNPIKNIRALVGADLFIFGGGSLIQNFTSTASLFYYIAIIYIANMLCKRTIMLSNGIGPIENKVFSRKRLFGIIAKAIDTFDFISVRDRGSQKLLSSILKDRKIHLVPDPALACVCTNQKKSFQTRKKDIVVYILCAQQVEEDYIYIKSFAKELKKVQKMYSTPLVIMVLNPTKDLKLAKMIAAQIENVKIACPKSFEGLFSLLSRAKFVISQRYHGALFSCMCNTPTFAISNDPKMHSLCRDLDLFPCQNTDILTSPDALQRKILEFERDSISKIDSRDKRIELYKMLANKQLNKIFEKN